MKLLLSNKLSKAQRFVSYVRRPSVSSVYQRQICRSNIRELDILADRYKNRITVLAVNMLREKLSLAGINRGLFCFQLLSDWVNSMKSLLSLDVNRALVVVGPLVLKNVDCQFSKKSKNTRLRRSSFL